MRAEYSKSEVALKQYTLCLVGLFFLLSAVGLVFLCIPKSTEQTVAVAAMTAVAMLAAVASLVVNWGVRRLAAWSRRPLIVLCLLAVPFYPIGTRLAIPILREIRRGTPPRLLSPEYEFLVRRTGRMTERTSLLTWIILFLICLLVLAVAWIARLPPEVRHMR
jgi:hypothetical protein